MDDEFSAAGLKRDAEPPSLPDPIRPSKKPRDEHLRDCFIITPVEGIGEKITCKYCPDYSKTNKKFNPTKSRSHLTDQCPGVDDSLRQALLEATQAARKSQNFAHRVYSPKDEASDLGASATAVPARNRKMKGRFRPSPAYISFHTDDTSLDVTAPIENGELILRLTFPTDHLKLNFNAGAEKNNMEGAALCIDGFMNMKPDASWTASLCSMTSEGTRAGPHCQWSLNPDISGVFEGGKTRVQKVEKLLKVMVMQ